MAVALNRVERLDRAPVVKTLLHRGIVGSGALKTYTGRHEREERTEDDMMDATPADLAACIENVAENRDRGAFETLFRHYGPRVKAMLVRGGAGQQEADEVMQETMVLIWRKAGQYDRSKASPSAWIYTIARNRRIDLLRKQQRPELDPEDPFFTMGQEFDDGEQTYGAMQRSEMIAENLKGLPPEQLLLVRKAFYEDKTHQEISAELDIPLGTVKSRLRIALKVLRQKLSGVDL